MARAHTPWILALVIATSCALAAAPARADSVDAAARSTARVVGQEAAKLYEAGDYAAALEKFNTADALLPSPTLGLYAARCLVKLGRLVEASERYLEVSRMQLERNAPKVMRKAQVEAVGERETLLPTIPTLEIQLEGKVGDGVAVSVDGKPLLPGLLGEKRPVNPGKYKVEAKRADATVAEEITVTPSQTARLVLKLPPLPDAPQPRMPALRKAGWAAIGVAGGGVIAGGVAGLVALSKGNTLLTKCANHVCTNAADYALTSSYDAARVASTAGFVVGAVALAAGVPMLVLAPKVEYAYPDGRPAPPPKGVAVQPLLTWGGAGVRGVF